MGRGDGSEKLGGLAPRTAYKRNNLYLSAEEESRIPELDPRKVWEPAVFMNNPEAVEYRKKNAEEQKLFLEEKSVSEIIDLFDDLSAASGRSFKEIEKGAKARWKPDADYFDMRAYETWTNEYRWEAWWIKQREEDIAILDKTSENSDNIVEKLKIKKLIFRKKGQLKDYNNRLKEIKRAREEKEAAKFSSLRI